MKLSMTLNYAGGFEESARQAVELEKVGLDVVWVAEAYSFDAPSFMGYLAAKTERVEIGSAILPIYSRTPTLIAMTAAGVDAVSGGRCDPRPRRLGPPGDRGLPRRALRPPAHPHPRDHRHLPRRVGRARRRSIHEGAAYHIPLPAGEGTGLGKALKIINHPVRPRIPIWVAALGEKNVAMTAEVADGWLPDLLRPREGQGGLRPLARRRRRPSGTPRSARCRSPPAGSSPSARSPRSHRSATSAAARRRSTSAAWAPRARTSTTRWPAATATRRRRPRSRTSTSRARRRRRRRWCPAELLEATSLCGPESYIKERVAALAEAGVTHLNVTPVGRRPGRHDRKAAKLGVAPPSGHRTGRRRDTSERPGRSTHARPDHPRRHHRRRIGAADPHR